MERICKIFNSRWSILLAFIPFVNFICIIFHFFMVEESRPSFFVKLLLGFPFIALLFILPEQWRWIAPQLSAAAIAAWMIVKGRGNYRTGDNARIPNTWKFIGTVLGTVLMVGIAIGVLSPSVSRNIDKAIDAFVHHDQQAWQSYMHPSCEESVKQLDILIRDFARSGIKISTDYKISSGIIEKSASNYPEGSTSYEKEVRMGNKYYHFYFIYLENEAGSGFIDFGITIG